MLTTEQMARITTDTLLGRQQNVVGPEADRFRASLARDMAEAKRLGYTISIPQEWEVEVASESPQTPVPNDAPPQS